ncbi:ATP-binding protein [Mucilaginibacter sp. UYCu711]|uniref:ATP-binding protein n=1 Tax=Mucilaginibacter sp. UYCu711 TaxID=3156339 RepID=UPI003D25A3C1
MTIDKLFRRQYETADAYKGVESIRHALSTQPALVVLDDEKIFGIITAGDVASSTYNLIADCVKLKPTVYPTQKVSEVLAIMNESFCEALPVNEGSVFSGIICREDILNYYQRVSLYNQRQLQGLAHDLRNPLTNIYTINNLLADNIKKQENKELIGYSRQSVDYILELLNLFLESEYLTESVVQYNEVNVNEILERCYTQAKLALTEKNITLTHVPKATKATVSGNAVHLQRVFGNLLSNAIKFSYPGDQITVTAENTRAELIVSIADRGIGIPEELKASIFEKFTPAGRPGTSGETTTGLGLYICKLLVEQHQGTIRINDNTTKGAVFHVSLPLI